MAEIRLGAAFEISNILRGRPKGSLVVHCPTCPEADFNEEEGVERTPFKFRQVLCSAKVLHHNSYSRGIFQTSCSNASNP